MVASATTFEPTEPRPYRYRKWAKEVTQTQRLQQDAFAMAREGSTELVRLKAMSMFKELGDWKRVLKGKPLPGSLKPELAKPAKHAAHAKPGKRDYLAQAAQLAKQEAGEQPAPPDTSGNPA